MVYTDTIILMMLINWMTDSWARLYRSAYQYIAGPIQEHWQSVHSRVICLTGWIT